MSQTFSFRFGIHDFCHCSTIPFFESSTGDAPSDSQSRAPTCNKHRVPFSSHISTSCFQTTPSQETQYLQQCKRRVASGAGIPQHPSRRPLVVSGAGSFQHPSRRSPSLLPLLESPVHWQWSFSDANVAKARWSLWKDPFPNEIMRPLKVRDPGNRFTENPSFVTLVEKTRGPAVSDGTHESCNSHDESGSSGTIKCPARLSQNSLPCKSPAPGKIPILFSRSNRASNTFNVSLPISCFNFPGTTETRMIAEGPVYKEQE